ncbi:SusD/RagB family nutrient-binding outer membrane lipoprotein [Pleomorphovibrio marinus]|uniref:SusD/RagB family nutrient-binding outer membrane lipoprotein n=1 Tax=Pleomorphovibrio marinus TaxID=2164132 RepID=UPI000E0B4428|nr:SusD/RagB family nutrient-binding outer membrane lipoprotein [Pleomorphovibrio marinus]
MKKALNYMICGALVMGTACSDFLDINESPNLPTSVTPDVLLPAGLAGSAFANNNELNRFGSIITSVTAGANNSPATYDIYTIDGANFNNQWRFEIFNGSLITYKSMIEAAEEINSPTYAGIGKIMTAYTFSIATDYWGDIPYSQALLGDENTSPELDTQEQIYLGGDGVQSLFDLVREGIADLQAQSAVTPGQDDVVYGGNAESWIKAGNALILKFANTISRVAPDRARQEIESVLQNGNFIASNDENMSFSFGSSVGSRSPIYEYTYVTAFSNDMMISTRFKDLLEGKNDPRLPLYVTRPTGEYVTIDNGFRGSLPTPTSSWSRFSSYVVGENGEGPVRFLTNAQIQFILAESALLLGTPGDPEEHFQNGVRASMALAGVSSANIDAYFENNADEVSLNGSEEENWEKIMTQKYIANYGNGVEQWNDYRRTGFPVLEDHQNAVGIDGTRPVRAQYINEEIARNTNFEVILPTEPVWWDID